MRVKRKSSLLLFLRGLYRIISFVKIEKNSAVYGKAGAGIGKAGAGIGKAGAGIGKAGIWK
jgi:hypothetical protein